MTELKEEKPDWLSDFQNNQATSGKQTYDEGHNTNVLDICSPEVPYVSPRFGRRSVAGVKSVENSPKKESFSETAPVTIRSRSARPALRNNILSNKSKPTFRDEQNLDSFTSSLHALQNDLENFYVDDLTKTYSNVPNPFSLNLFESKSSDNLEDSWNSLNIFNVSHKGRLGSTERFFLPKNKEQRHIFKRDETQKLLIVNENIEVGKTCHNFNTKSCESFKQKNETTSLEESLKVCENTSSINVNACKNNIRDFIVPELPQGKNLICNIKTTWGDKHYLGLNGIEIFNSKGEKVKIKSIAADPPDINVLPEYSKDPRVVENLIDNIYLTQDDMHMWLVPFTPNSSHFIFIEFFNIEELAMLRIWNYNKSRIHCFRGAKDVEIKLDNKFIFIGEIARASGEILNTLNCLGDTILFTTDEDILELVAQNDEYFNYSILEHLEDDQSIQEELRPLTGKNKIVNPRPFTCPKNKLEISADDCSHSEYNEKSSRDDLGLSETQSSELGKGIIDGNCESSSLLLMEQLHNDRNLEEITQGSLEQQPKDDPGGLLESDEFNKIISHKKSEDDDELEEKSNFLNKNYTLYIPCASFLASDSAYETLSMPTGYSFTIQIHSTWGDLYYVGLNGLQMFDENNEEIQIEPSNITAEPESVNVLEGIDNDARTPEKLIDGINDSTDGCHMWLAPVLPQTINRIDLVFENPVTLSCLKLWNYAKTPSRGVREFGILVDGLLIYNGELEQAGFMTTADGSSRVPCKTVNFSDAKRVQSSKHLIKLREETSGRIQYSADQSQRPLTTMTSS